MNYPKTKNQRRAEAAKCIQKALEYLETAEVLLDPKAMKAIRDAERGRTKSYSLSDLPD